MGPDAAFDGPGDLLVRDERGDDHFDVVLAQGNVAEGFAVHVDEKPVAGLLHRFSFGIDEHSRRVDVHVALRIGQDREDGVGGGGDEPGNLDALTVFAWHRRFRGDDQDGAAEGVRGHGEAEEGRGGVGRDVDRLDVEGVHHDEVAVRAVPGRRGGAAGAGRAGGGGRLGGAPPPGRAGGGPGGPRPVGGGGGGGRGPPRPTTPARGGGGG